MERIVERRRKTGEVHCGGYPSAVCVHGFEAKAAIRPGNLLWRPGKHARSLGVVGYIIAHLARRASINQRRALAHSLDANRRENVLLHEVLVRLVREFFDNAA